MSRRQPAAPGYAVRPTAGWRRGFPPSRQPRNPAIWLCCARKERRPASLRGNSAASRRRPASSPPTRSRCANTMFRSSRSPMAARRFRRWAGTPATACPAGARRDWQRGQDDRRRHARPCAGAGDRATGNLRRLAWAREEMQLQLGGRRLTVVDDAYNANPGSMRAALDRLNDLQCRGRRIAVLGQMAELGPQAASYHTELAARSMTRCLSSPQRARPPS